MVCQFRAIVLANRRKRSHTGAYCVVAAVVYLSVVIGCGSPAPVAPGGQNQSTPIIGQKRTNPPMPPAYSVLAKLLAKSFSASIDPERKPDAAQIIAEANGGILELSNIHCEDTDVEAIARDSAASTREVISVMEAVRRLPKPSGDTELFFAGLLYGFTGDFQTPARIGREETAKIESLQSQGRQFVAAATRLKADELMLPRVASRYAGPPVSSGCSILLDFDEALLPEQKDSITVTNNSGLELHNCTVLIELISARGETCQNVHFIPVWQNGQGLHAKYAVGTQILGDWVGRETVFGVERIETALYCDEVSQERMPYQYAGAEKDRDFERYLAEMKGFVRYRPFSGGVIWDDQRAVFLSFAGLPRLPKGTATVTLRHGGETSNVQLSFESWSEREEKKIEFPQIKWDPDGGEIQIQLEGSGYRKVFNWIRKP